MSYEIIYSVFTIKQGENYYPYCISGSNNCTELNIFTGREQRERSVTNLSWLYKGEATKGKAWSDIPLKNPEEVKELLDFEGITKNRAYGNIQGRFTAKAIYNNAVSKVIEAKDISARTKINHFYYNLEDEERDKANKVREQIQAELLKKILTDTERAEAYERFMNALNDKELEKKMRELYTVNTFFYMELSKISLKHELDRLKKPRVKKTYSKDELRARIENSKDKLKAEDYKPSKDRNNDYATALTDYETGLKQYREAIKEKFLGKQVIIKQAWSSCNDIYRRGRIKAVGSEDIIGFFPTGKRRYYRIGFFDSDATIKVEEITEMKK